MTSATVMCPGVFCRMSITSRRAGVARRPEPRRRSVVDGDDSLCAWLSIFQFEFKHKKAPEIYQGLSSYLGFQLGEKLAQFGYVSITAQATESFSLDLSDSLTS
jgi:hypothetical protein